MALSFYIGSSGSGKSFQLYQKMIQDSLEHPDVNYLIIVPDQFTMETQMDMVAMHPNQGIMNIDVLSFSRLTYRIFGEVGGTDRPVLDDTGKSLVLRKIAADYQADLQIIGRHLKKIGYIHEVKSAISEFMQYGIGPEELERMIAYSEKRGTLKSKLSDLQILYSGFQNYIAEKFITTEESLDILREKIPKSALISNSVVVFDGFTGFTPVQNKVIGELMIWAKDVWVTVTIDGRENPYAEDGEQKLFHLSKKTLLSLREIAKKADVPLGEDVILTKKPVWRFAKNSNHAMAHLEKELFRFQNMPYQKEQDSIHILEASSPREEIRQICILMKELVRTKGYSYRDFAVVTGDLLTYAKVVEAVFETFQIPVFLDETKGIILNPFVEYIRSALKIVMDNFQYEGMFHFLRCGLCDFPMETVDRLENYVLAYGIRGKKQWSRPFFYPPKEEGALEELENLRKEIMEMLDVLLCPKQTANDWVQALYSFIVNANVAEKLDEYGRRFLEKKEARKAKEYTQIYPMIMTVLEQIVDLLGEEEMGLLEFADILDAGFGEIQVGSIPQNVDKVVVGDVERTRLNKVKVLFFAGVNDGFIPKMESTGGIISDLDREFLLGTSIEIAPTPRQKMYMQRLYLYMNMVKPTDRLYLSFARTGENGKSLRPAYLIDTIKKLYPALSIERPERLPMEEQLQSYEDGLTILAKSMRDFSKGVLEEQEDRKRFFTLYHNYQENPVYKKLLKRLEKEAFFQYQAVPLAKELAQALYGQILWNSVSRLEKFASCAYAHFLQYGLELKERDSYSFEAMDMGNVYHGVLENFADRLKKEGLTWGNFTKEQGEDFVAEALEQWAADYGATVLLSTSRNQYAVGRMRRILNRTIHTLQYQIKKGLFMPKNFEISFSQYEDLDSIHIDLSEQEKMYLRGRIDREDTYEDEERVYVKVIDYKSGNQKFDLAALYYGLQLQLVVYMNAAVEIETQKHPDKEIIPAAMFYYHIDDPMIEAEVPMTPEEVNAAIVEELRVTGVIRENEEIIRLLDREFTDKSDVMRVAKKKDGTFTAASEIMEKNSMEAVFRYVSQKIKSIGQEILEGNIQLNPYEKDSVTACTYCDFKDACRFDKQTEGFDRRDIGELDKQRALENIEKEAL